MKARILALLAMVLGVVSCQTEPEGLDVNVGGEQEVAICVTIPETETRAGGLNSALGVFDNGVLGGDATMRYILQVYYKTTENGEVKYTASKERLVKYDDGKSVTFPVRLVPGRNYQFVVWADVVDGENAGDKHYNTADLANVQLNRTWFAMDETRDAFTATQLVENYNSTSSINITLKRPFAKLRVVTTDMVALNNLGIKPTKATVTYSGKHYNAFNALAGNAIADSKNRDITHEKFDIASYGEKVDEGADMTLFTDYFFAEAGDVVKFELTVYDQNGVEDVNKIKYNFFNTDIAVQRNYLTTIKGNILTDGKDVTVTVEDAFEGNVDYDSDKDEQAKTVNTAADFAEAFSNENIDVIVLNGNINLDELVTRSAADKVWTIAKDKELTLDLNGYTLSATSVEKGKNFYMFNSYGTLNIKNGTILYQHNGDNMEWNNCTSIFYAGANGTLNLDGVIAKNLGGSDMAYVVDMTNAQNINVNIENSTLESTYIAVRVFNNSKTGVNNVDIKNTTLSGKYCFWVQYWLADGRDEATLEQTLNINIYNQGNTFTYTGASAVIYGFNETVYANEDGITKKVSEDGTEVVLGSMTDDGLVRRGVAGTEENTTITKAVVGEGITTLYDRTFRRFYALETVVLPSTLTTIGAAGSGVFQSCNALKNIVIPESVTVLGEGTFAECSSLESINIPSGVTRIEKNTFNFSGIKSVEFHEGVTYFGAQAFRDCKQLKEVIIKAPEFTIEANAFGVMSGTLPGTTIYVANAEMKAYLESTLAYKNQFTVVAPDSVASKEDLPVENGKLDTNFEEDVNLYGDITVSASETNADSGYGATGVTVTDGAVLNGQGHKLTVNNAWGTWDCVVAAKGGTIKNLTVSSAMRGIFMPRANGDVFIDNVIFDNVIYTFNSDGGNKNYGVYISNSTLNGWTSHSDVHKEVVYTNCSFGKGNGYAFCRPYGPTSFVGCNFCEGFEVEAIGKVTFENCTIGGVALTAENLFTLVVGGIANASVK